MSDWLQGGSPSYHLLTHCMRGDKTWAYLYAGLSVTLLGAYLGIAWVWARAALAGPKNTRRKLLLAMFLVFVLCGSVHLSRAVSIWWPGYRLFVILLVPLNLASWFFLVCSAPRVREVFVPEGDSMFESAFHAGGVGFALVEPGTNRILRSNSVFASMLGYLPQEIAGLTVEELTHPKELASDLALWDQVASKVIPHYSIRKRFLHRRGHWVWGDLTVSAALDKRGRVLHSISQVRDVSAEVAAKEALTAEIKHLRLELEVSRSAKSQEATRSAEAIKNAIRRLDTPSG